MANEDYLRISVKGRFAGGPFTINAEERIGFSSRLASMRIADHPIFTVDGRISAIQAKLLHEPALAHLIAEADLQRGESLHFFNNAATLYLIRPAETRALAAIDALVSLANRVEIQKAEELDFSKLPPAFHPLIPLVKEWAVDDDSDREQLVSGSSETALSALVEQVEPFMQALDSYLDSFAASPSPEAAALARLAEGVREAKQCLEARATKDR